MCLSSRPGRCIPLLHNLEEKGMLTVYEKEAGNKVRKYYSITKQGKKILDEKKDEWELYSKAVASVLGTALV